MTSKEEIPTTTQIRIKNVPKRMPNADEHFELIQDVKLDELKENQLLIETEYISVDPYQRGRMPIWFKTPSKQMQSFSVSKVISSKDPNYVKGDYVYGVFPWSTKNIINSKSIMSKVPPNLSDYKPKQDKDYNPDLDTDEKFDINEIKNIPHSYYVGSMGMPGVTAYYGMIVRGKLKKGETVLISGAAGAVGSVCGQIAKQIYGCHVVGICGTAEKVQWLKDLSFDGAVNYKKYGDDVPKIKKRLKQEFPNGIDFYFDNVGGPFTAAVWDVLNANARVIVCGQISTYNSDNSQPTLRPMLGKLIYKEINIRGILVTNFKDKEKFYNDMIKWISDGKIKVKQTVVNGFDNAIQAFINLFSGVNTGKMVVKCV
eukprot:285367_1